MSPLSSLHLMISIYIGVICPPPPLPTPRTPLICRGSREVEPLYLGEDLPMRFTARPRMGRLRAVGRCLRGGPRRDRPLMGPRGRPRPPPEGVRRLRVWFARLLACRSANAACQKCAARQSRVKTHRELLREFRSICFERFAHLLQNRYSKARGHVTMRRVAQAAPIALVSHRTPRVRTRTSESWSASSSTATIHLIET